MNNLNKNSNILHNRVSMDFPNVRSFTKALSNIPPKKNLSKMIEYLNTLKKENEIDDEIFSALLHYACGIYIENEIEKRVASVFQNSSWIFF